MWVKILDGKDIEVRCIRNIDGSKKRYRYESKVADEVQVIGHEDNSPTETSMQSGLHRFLKSMLMGNVIPNEMDSRIISIKNELESNIEYDKTVSEAEMLQKQSEEEIKAKYTDLYTGFEYFLREFEMTPLELIVATSHCLGVGKPREIVRAFIGYFQTYVGYKGTNVIAIGSPASGKSFILESALSMIPEERVIKGAKSVPYFFNKYNQKDLTGYIFFLGDLGGDEDDQDTIRFRDKLKQLSTDGYVERGLMDKETNEEQDQWVEGFPSLSYSTAHEEMVNEQEKTRSILLTPNPIDGGKLAVFNFIMENHGAYHDKIEKLFSIRDSIKGLVYKFNVDDYDWFNPYMFCIVEHLKDHDDFNRKILEFNAILKLVTILNNPQKLQHQMYYDEDYEEKDTNVFISSKRDNINALNIFDSANLLPDETRFANGIIKEYNVIQLQNGTVSEDELWEDQVRSELSYNIDENGRIVLDSDLRKKCFTLKSLGAEHRNKRWYRKSRNYISERINRLVDENVIVNIGKEQGTGHNVYCLNKGMTSSVDSPLPDFDNNYNVGRATTLFTKVFPQQVDEYIEFVKNDKSVDTTDIFEIVEPIIPDLPYLESVFDGL